jgi:small subunit ribosomal protein S7
MRKSKPKKRILLPDPKFNDTLVTRFVNNLMYDGKKSTAFALFYDAVEMVEKKTSENGLDTWKKALMKWLINYSRNRNEKTMADKLAGEIIAASKNEGAAVKKKEDTHRMAEANKAFSHFKV